MNSAIKSQLAIANPLGVLQELKLSHKGLSNVPTATIANQFRAMESYDLGNLDKVAEEFDELCIGTKDEEERKMASTAMLIGEFSSITCDKTNLLEDRLSTALDLFNLNIHSMIVIPLTSCIRQAQLFNVEKRFGCVEESYRALRHENEGKGEMFVSLPPSYRQKLDNPYKPEEPTPELRKEGRKKKKKKPPGAFKALLALQATAKLAIKDMQEIKQTLRNIEKQPYTIPKPPPYFTYADVPVPEDVPEHIRQRFFDAEFAYEEVLALQNEASKQLNKVRSAFAAWDNAGTEVWYVHLKATHPVKPSGLRRTACFIGREGLCADFDGFPRETGIKHIHEMPTFREYEHTRISLQAMFTIASRQEVKIVEFYSSEGAPELPPAMNEAFRLKAMSLEEFKEDWVRVYEAIFLESVASLGSKERDLNSILRSVFDLVSRYRGYADPQLGDAPPSTTEPVSPSGQDTRGSSQDGQAKD